MIHRNGIINKDWYGQPCPNQEFALTLDHQQLCFQATTQGMRHLPDLSNGQFYEGLWHYDVAELFLSTTGSDNRYIEAHIAASGAWWLMGFTDIRYRDNGNIIQLNTIKTSSQQKENHDVAELKIPTSVLYDYLGNDQLTFNVCFISQQPLHFMSHVKLPGEKPDFHQPQFFITLG